MKKFRWIIWVLVILLAGTAIWFWKFRKKEEPVVLETEKPHIGPIATSITATGTIQPVDTVAVGTQVSGTIQNIYVDFNSRVKKGQLLAELDKSLFLAQVNQYTASLQSAKEQLVYQTSNFARQTQLYNAGAISKADFETAQYQYSAAKANVAGIEAQLSAAQKNLSFASIYSPINGTVLSRNVSVGQTVAASFNTPTLFSIAKDLTKMQVRAAIDEADIGNVKKGQQVNFTVDAFPDDVFKGTVEDIRLQPSVSANVVTYTTIIGAPNDDMKLKPGMTASITVYTKQIENAMLISARAVKFTPDSALLKNYTIIDERKHSREEKHMGQASEVSMRDYPAHRDSSRRKNDNDSVKRAVVWLKKDSTITRKVIRTGLTDDTQVQVLAGLTADDEVIDGMQQVQSQKNGANNVRSPFMPARRPGGGSGGSRQGGGGGGGRPNP